MRSLGMTTSPVISWLVLRGPLPQVRRTHLLALPACGIADRMSVCGYFSLRHAWRAIACRSAWVITTLLPVTYPSERREFHRHVAGGSVKGRTPPQAGQEKWQPR